MGKIQEDGVTFTSLSMAPVAHIQSMGVTRYVGIKVQAPDLDLQLCDNAKRQSRAPCGTAGLAEVLATAVSQPSSRLCPVLPHALPIRADSGAFPNKLPRADLCVCH